VRLFFAVLLPSEVRAALGGLQSANDDYRWVDPSTMHITLAFVGEQPEDRLGELERIGGEAARSRPGTLRLGPAGQFGSKRAPRVLWVDIAGEVDRLLALQSRLADGLRAARFPVEEREFRAHITLARRRETARGGAPSGWPPGVEHASFELNHLTLMQSRLGPRGATYTRVFEFQLTG